MCKGIGLNTKGPESKVASPLFIATAIILFLVLVAVTRYPVLNCSKFIILGEEELARGVLPVHMDQGLLMPYYMYQFDEYNGGGMITGLLAYPFFKIFGPNYFALKLTALVFSAMLIIVLTVIAGRLWGRRAVVFLGIAFIAAPSFYLERSMVAFGNHLEVATFVAIGAALFWFSRIKANSAMLSGAAMVLLGANSGFAVYCEYEYLIFMAVLFLFFYATRKSFTSFGVDLLLFWTGFAVGFMPWRQYHQGVSAISYFYDFFAHGPQVPGKEGSYNNVGYFLQAITTHFVAWFESKDLYRAGRILIRGWVFDLALFSAFASSYIYIVNRTKGSLISLVKGLNPKRNAGYSWNESSVLTLVVIFIPFHLLAFAMYKYSGPEPLPPHRYLHIMFPFYFIAISSAASLLWIEGKKAFAGAILALVLFGGIGGNLGMFRDSQCGYVFKAPGYSYHYFPQMLQPMYNFYFNEDAYWEYATTSHQGYEQEFGAGFAAGIAYLNGQDIIGHVNSAISKGADAAWSFASGLGVAAKVTIEPEKSRPEMLLFIIPPEHIAGYRQGLSDGTHLKESFQEILHPPEN